LLVVFLVLLGLVLIVPIVVFIYNLFVHGPREAFESLWEGVTETLMTIWLYITFPFRLVIDIIRSIFKLFKR
jgi:hypothetical protein